jgi:hypothetical protein
MYKEERPMGRQFYTQLVQDEEVFEFIKYCYVLIDRFGKIVLKKYIE